jgi:extracellular factor (EF) 3-hydroxypalmitic acid methyl ester biosynthesis protein
VNARLLPKWAGKHLLAFKEMKLAIAFPGGMEVSDSAENSSPTGRCFRWACTGRKPLDRGWTRDDGWSPPGKDFIATPGTAGVSLSSNRGRSVALCEDWDRRIPIVSPKLQRESCLNSATRPRNDMENLVAGRNSQQEEIRGSVLRLDLQSVAFEICGPPALIRTSEVLTEFQITFNDQPVYFGRAVVNNLIAAGSAVICDASLEDSWLRTDAADWHGNTDAVDGEFSRFLDDWQGDYAIRDQFKLVVSDMSSFLHALRAWMDRVELGIRTNPPAEQRAIEEAFLRKAAPKVARSIDSIWARFGPIAEEITEELRPTYRSYLRRRLHSLLLCSPFAYRTHAKPLGYAGDYEMVNMIVRSPFEGESLFSKAINHWLLQQPPAEAHRNRLDYLTGKLVEEVARVVDRGGIARILNLGCGPAIEVQRFIQNSPLADYVRLTLLDFNEETVAFVSREIENCRRSHGRRTEVKCQRKSVQHVLKEAGRTSASDVETYDFIYCAGLFDYIFDQVCSRLMNAFYSWLAPGGLLLATNVNAGKAYRYSLDFMLDWHLIDRDARQFRRLAPSCAVVDRVNLYADHTGSNLFMTIRKPEDV